MFPVLQLVGCERYSSVEMFTSRPSSYQCDAELETEEQTSRQSEVIDAAFETEETRRSRDSAVMSSILPVLQPAAPLFLCARDLSTCTGSSATYSCPAILGRGTTVGTLVRLNRQSMFVVVRINRFLSTILGYDWIWVRNAGALGFDRCSR